MTMRITQPERARFASPLARVLPVIAVTAVLINISAAWAAGPRAPEIAVSVNGQLHSQNDELADLGETLVGKPNTVRVRLVNPGDATLHVTAIRFGGDDVADFQLSDPDDTFSIEPTGVLSRGRIVDLVFTPSHEGTERSVMSIANDSATPTFKLRFRATGVVRPVLQLSVEGQAIGDGGTFDFGSISRDQARSGTNNHALELKNVGNAPLTITSRSSTDKFGVDSLSFPNSAFTLAPDQTRTSVLAFGVFGTIVGAGPREGDLSIVNNTDRNPFTLHLKVNVLGPRIDARVNDVSLLTTFGHDFGSVVVGQTASATLTIASIGSEPLNGRIDITPLGTTQDYRVGAANRNFSLVPGEIFTSPLTVTPAAVGPVTAFLTVETNAGSFGFQFATNGIEASQAIDCNHNGVDDVTDISAGTSRDCNANSVPDECEPDSDGNGVIDACEAAGALPVPGAPPVPDAPAIPVTPGTPDNDSPGNPSGPGTNPPSDPGDATGSPTNDGAITPPDENKDDSDRLTSADGNEAATPENDSGAAAASIPPPGVCGFGSAAVLPMMAVTLCGMRGGRLRRRHGNDV